MRLLDAPHRRWRGIPAGFVLPPGAMIRVALILGIWLSPVSYGGSPCNAVATARDRAAYWLISQGDLLTLYRCSGTDCNERVGSRARASVLEHLVDGMVREKRAIEVVSECVEKRAVAEDNLLARFDLLSDVEKRDLRARHAETIAEARALRARLNALNEAARTFPSRLRVTSVRLALTPETEPLLHRLTLEAFNAGVSLP